MRSKSEAVAATAWRSSAVVRTESGSNRSASEKALGADAPRCRTGDRTPVSRPFAPGPNSSGRTSSVTSRAPAAQKTAAMVDLPWPDSPTKASARPPRLDGAPVEHATPRHRQQEGHQRACDDDGDHLVATVRHGMAHHPGQVGVDDEVGHAHDPAHVAVPLAAEGVPGKPSSSSSATTSAVGRSKRVGLGSPITRVTAALLGEAPCTTGAGSSSSVATRMPEQS